MICKGLTVVVLSFYEPSLVSLVCTGRYHQHVSWAQRGVAGPMVCGNGGCHLLCHQSCFMWGRNWVIRSCTSGIASEVGFPRMTGPPNLEIWHEFFPDFHPDLGQSWIILGVWNHQTTNFNQLQPTSTNTPSFFWGHCTVTGWSLPFSSHPYRLGSASKAQVSTANRGRRWMVTVHPAVPTSAIVWCSGDNRVWEFGYGCCRELWLVFSSGVSSLLCCYTMLYC